MATLIIEIVGRHGHHYHKVEKPVVRVGRALDNDIILPDPAVSPHHFVLRADPQGDYELRPLANENGIHIGRRRIDQPLPLDELPLEFDAGRTHIRILDPAQPVAPTRIISCRAGGLCLFSNWGWSFLLFLGMVLLSAADNYLSTPQTLSWKSYWRDQVVITMAALSLSVGLLIVNRIVSHRWDYLASLSFVSLMLIVAFVLDQLIPLADYFFTSPMPGYTISILWSLLILPFALGWFLVNLNHGSVVGSVIFTILLLSPAAYYQLDDAMTQFSWFEDFTKTAYYSRSLSPWDQRIEATASIDEFTRINSDFLLRHAN
ncbi:MAG: FHA domain-containing protein [Chromatiaceae bacterium]|nr:FHA domain-containing protein [Chromatiaceae bacterium]MCP5314429.1 FHA domain-containing protein [Chromatiaceae bacterium]